MTLSKLESGRAYRNLESFTLEYAIDLTLARLNKTMPSQKISKIVVDLPAKLPLVLADIDGLVEVLDKLLDNAVKFTPEEGEIAISAKIVADNQQMLEIIIADTGRGIESQLLEIIFDRFAQSESYLRRTVNGVGLGLVICRQIIQSMGGKIWAKSPGENQGSEFHFTLKLESPVAIAAPKKSLTSKDPY